VTSDFKEEVCTVHASNRVDDVTLSGKIPPESSPSLPGLQDAEQATALLAAIVESSDDAIISKNLDGIITSWNKSAERLFGYSEEEAVGKHITLIVPTDRRDEEVKILQQLRRGERVDHFETVRVRKDGKLLDISLTISPVKDGAGRVIGASKVARDITEQRRSERALAEQGRLLDLSNDAILVRDAADRITYWNNGASEIYGYTRAEALGRISHDLLHTEFSEPLERITEKLHCNNRWTGQLIHKRNDGRKITVVSRWVLDRYENTEFVLETNNDITQQKRNEEALHESEERLRLLILMSPMSPFVVAYQRLFYYRQWPEPTLWLVAATYAAGAFIIGATLVLAYQDRFAEQL